MINSEMRRLLTHIPHKMLANHNLKNAIIQTKYSKSNNINLIQMVAWAFRVAEWVSIIQKLLAIGCTFSLLGYGPRILFWLLLKFVLFMIKIQIN